MNCIATDIEGLYVVENFNAQDDRGVFVKDFHSGEFTACGLDVDFKEMYYSISHKGVIRGMHFQAPPCDHIKLVHVVSGAIVDVVVDLRSGSATKGQYRVFEIDDTNHQSIYIPRGMAHGFLATKDNTIVSYKVSSVYNPQCDQGLAYNSFGYNWGVENPIMSTRDQVFATLKEVLTKNYF